MPRVRRVERGVVCRHGPLAQPDGACPCERDCYCRDPKSVVSPKCLPGEHVYWITRDADPDGTLSEFCDLWTTLPTRLRYDGDCRAAFWMGADGEWSMRHHYQTASVAEVRHWFRVVPETDLECIRVG